jgi:hypothetical protein
MVLHMFYFFVLSESPDNTLNSRSDVQ